MRSVLGYAALLAVTGCGVSSTPVDPHATAEAVAYAEETDRAIDVAIALNPQGETRIRHTKRRLLHWLKEPTQQSAW